jgi:FixJ family two-component response regulator
MPVAIHIIEDDPAVREAVRELLAVEGRSVLTYESPEAFFAAPLPGPTDIVILDIHFPESSGVDVAQRLKRDFPKIQIVVISGVRAGLLARALIAVEPAASFRKPLEAAAFVACIRRLAGDA